MKENSIRRAVREGRAALGTGLREFASRGVPRIIEAAGFDYCMIDMEHGAFDLETIADLAAWFAATDVSPIVRIHKAFIHYIPLLLDQGIMGIQLQLEHPRFKEVVRTIAATCRKYGKLARGSAETEAQIEEYWHLGCQVLNLPGTDTSTYLEGLKARASRAHARLQALGVPTPRRGT